MPSTFSRRPLLILATVFALVVFFISLPYRSQIPHLASDSGRKLASSLGWHVDTAGEDLGDVPGGSGRDATPPSVVDHAESSLGDVGGNGQGQVQGQSGSSWWSKWRPAFSSSSSSSSAGTENPRYPTKPIPHNADLDPSSPHPDPHLDLTSYRAHLEATTSPLSYHLSLNPTMSFSHIYVLSLPNRLDRRENMKRLMLALGLKFTFVDAVPKDAPVISWIGERVKEVREWKKVRLAEHLGVSEDKIGSNGIGTVWLWSDGDYDPEKLDDLEFMSDEEFELERPFVLPPLNGSRGVWGMDGKGMRGPPDRRGEGGDHRWPGGVDWVTHLYNSDPSTLYPSDPNFDLNKELWDDLEGNQFRQIKDSVLATWYSQFKVWRLMKENGDESGLVFEDDVDIEWDIARIWGSIEKRLPKPRTDYEKAREREEEEVREDENAAKPDWLEEPKVSPKEAYLKGLERWQSESGRDGLRDLGEDGWEVVFLGHCWGKEASKPGYIHPLLHQSTEPRCLHGYALSRAGYTRLIDELSDPWIAYQGAIDTAVPTLIKQHKLAAYSVEPSIVIQSKDTKSDIQVGVGSPWKGVLSDSTLERVWRDQGKEFEELTYEDAIRNPNADPATLWHVQYTQAEKMRMRAKKAQSKTMGDWRGVSSQVNRPKYQRPANANANVNVGKSRKNAGKAKKVSSSNSRVKKVAKSNNNRNNLHRGTDRGFKAHAKRSSNSPPPPRR